MCEIIRACCCKERLWSHVLPGVAEEGDKVLSFLIFDVRVFKSCEEERVSFVVPVAMVLFLVCHSGSNE